MRKQKCTSAQRGHPRCSRLGQMVIRWYILGHVDRNRVLRNGHHVDRHCSLRNSVLVNYLYGRLVHFGRYRSRNSVLVYHLDSVLHSVLVNHYHILVHHSVLVSTKRLQIRMRAECRQLESMRRLVHLVWCLHRRRGELLLRL